MELVRSYVGIIIPGAIWPKLNEAQMNVRKKSMSGDIKWDAQNETFLTLCTLSEQPMEMLQRANSLLPQVVARHPGMDLKLEGLVGIPNQTQPRHIYVNVTGETEALCDLQADLARTLAPMMTPTEKAFQPLIHLGRLKVESEQARTALGRGVRMVPNEVYGEFRASVVDLLISQAGPSGVALSGIGRYRLGS
jgi:2'-5' RNA ligase